MSLERVWAIDDHATETEATFNSYRGPELASVNRLRPTMSFIAPPARR
jgi:hypothetical protein